MARYQKPGWFMRRAVNPLLAFLVRRFGMSVRGAHILAIRGRRTGAWRYTPVNVLGLDGHRYLLAPRGETEWVRNLRASRRGELHLGANVEPISVTELGDDEKPPVLRAYLRRWKPEVGRFFAVGGPEVSDAEFRRIAPDHPIFRIET